MATPPHYEDGVIGAPIQGRRTVHAALENAVAAWADRPALLFEGSTISFRSLQELALLHLGELQALGLSKGDTVLFMLENSPDFVALWLAAGMSGMIEVPVNTEYQGALLRHVLEDSGATVIVTTQDFVAKIEMVRPSSLRSILLLDGVTEDLTLEQRRLGICAPRKDLGFGHVEPTQETDPLAIMYTSGTTGVSKGAVIVQRHAFEYARAVTEVLKLTPADVYYAPLPLFHVAGQWAVVYACLQQGSCAALKRRFSLSRFWDDCRADGVTTGFLLGAMAQFLIGSPASELDADNPLDRILLVPLVDDVQDFRDRFDVRVTTCYGSTESNVPIVSDFEVSDPRVVGRARLGFDLMIADELGEPVPTGEVGELYVRPPESNMTLLRYHGNSSASAEATSNLWLHTGDAMTCDAEGIYRFVDRINDAIRRRGENISSFEVEREVRAHPAVLECAAVGVASRYTEQEVVVFAILQPGVTTTEDELKEFVRQVAPRFMIPDRIIIVDELPKTPTGKIQKFELRQQIESR